MANDLVTQGLISGLSVGNQGFEGLEDFSSRDLGIQATMLRIVQKKRRNDKGNLGDLRLGNEDPVESIKVVILGGKNQRFLYEGPDGKQRLTCMSGNGQQPAGDVLQSVKNATCPDCDYAQWTDHPTEKGKDGKPKRVPPPCAPTVVFLGLRLQEEGKPTLPFWFVCSKSAFNPAREFAAEVRSSAQRLGIKSFRQLLVKISTDEIQGERGAVYYVPHFSVVEVHPEWLEQFRDLFLATQDLVYVPAGLTSGKAVAPEDQEEHSEPPAGNGPIIETTATPAGGGPVPF